MRFIVLFHGIIHHKRSFPLLKQHLLTVSSTGDASRNLQGIGEVWRSLAPLSWGSGVDRQLAEMPRPHHWAIEHIPFLKHLAQQGLISESHGRNAVHASRPIGHVRFRHNGLQPFGAISFALAAVLITSSGRALDAAESLALRDGDDVITAVALRMELTAAVKAVALWCYGGDRIVTWGDPRLGGDASAIRARSLADPAVPMSLAPCMEIWHLFGCTRERLWQHLDGSLRVLPGFFEAMPVPPLIDNGGRSACGSGAVALRTTSATCWTGGLSTVRNSGYACLLCIRQLNAGYVRGLAVVLAILTCCWLPASVMTLLHDSQHDHFPEQSTPLGRFYLPSSSDGQQVPLQRTWKRAWHGSTLHRIEQIAREGLKVGKKGIYLSPSFQYTFCLYSLPDLRVGNDRFRLVLEVRVRPGAFKEHGDHYKPFGSARGG
ncbi:unnamed protein product [Cladocopium goreaui]|uniref:Beta-galactosidase n=1 Tax=Cladocopium goreaui TaxID=2562237 RepID=A0A9P1DFP3_9DINO|nr:unnamed protein product [Cladocopium goreaui]